MTELHLVHMPEDRPPQGHVILVHGLGGDPFGTWRHDSGAEGFWPDWLAADVLHAAVHSLSPEPINAVSLALASRYINARN
jgi:hypothetical protein